MPFSGKLTSIGTLFHVEQAHIHGGPNTLKRFTWNSRQRLKSSSPFESLTRAADKVILEKIKSAVLRHMVAAILRSAFHVERA